MKIVSAAALLALANFASAGQVSNDLSNENIRDADAVLKEHAKIDAAAERAAAAANIGEQCEAKTEVLSTCFELNNEPDGAACWEDCVAPAAEAFDTCDGFCNSVELCRRVKCSSGPACASNYYDVLNCVLKDDEGAGECACTGSLDLEETPAVTEVADVVPPVDEAAVTPPPENEDICMDQTKDLKKCFAEAEETDGADCWEDCTLPATENTDSCESFCAAVETCRAERCSSGPACASSYYTVLNCIMADEDNKCVCGSGAIEADATAEGPYVEEEAVMMLEKDGCMDQTMDLMKCFADAEETDGPDCWEDCTIPADKNTDSCEGFCAAVETCRAEKCSSGSACAGRYYNVLNCIMDAEDTDEKCTCSGGPVEADVTTEGSCTAGDAAGTCADA